MEIEQTNDFNIRLSQWVSSQGFWFQLRYSMSGGGSKGVLGFHLLRLMARFAIFLVVAAIGLWVYLVKLPGTAGFQLKLKQAIADGLGAKEDKMEGFKQERGLLTIQRWVGVGGNQAFYSAMEARTIKCQLGLLTCVLGDWYPGVMSINQLDMELNAGADDDKSAALIGDSLFRDFGRFKVEALQVKEATLRWGYSGPTQGKIVGSHLKMQRLPDGWRIHFSGGTFSQSWLERLEIVELVANCTREGVEFEKAEFRKGAGKVTMDGLKVVAGQRPEVKGVVKVSKLALVDLIPFAAQEFIDGVISGDFRVFGSTNTTEGIGLEGNIAVDGENSIKLRDRLYLLRALTDFDVFNNYRTVHFVEGSLHIKTQGGGMEVSELQLKAGDLMTLAGQMRVRFPTPQEASLSVRRNRAGEALSAARDADDKNESMKRLEDSDISLRRAARELHKEKGKGKTGAGVKDQAGISLFDHLGQSFETSILAEQAAERASRSLMYEGQFQVTLSPDTFENVQALREMLPVDPQTGRIPLEVPIKGDIYSITFDQAEDLYLRGRRY
ncbi:MAG: hypothetical protein WCP45_01405 [Verrucomicrobiota bacterium]